MKNLIDELRPIGKKVWKKYKVELIFICISLIISLVSLVTYFHGYNPEENEELIQEIIEPPKNITQKIFIDVSGAVKKPDVYKVNFGARVKDIINLAGGYSDDADKVYFTRNFNLARLVSDQEKIYVPAIWEINSGIFTENPQILSNFQTNKSNITTTELPSLININEASEQELDRLPGIGKVTADKIIMNRPYSNLSELINKKAVGKSVYEKIKDLIEI